jgi:hypothetical protein
MKTDKNVTQSAEQHMQVNVSQSRVPEYLRASSKSQSIEMDEGDDPKALMVRKALVPPLGLRARKSARYQQFQAHTELHQKLLRHRAVTQQFYLTPK